MANVRLGLVESRSGNMTIRHLIRFLLSVELFSTVQKQRDFYFLFFLYP